MTPHGMHYQENVEPGGAERAIFIDSKGCVAGKR